MNSRSTNPSDVEPPVEDAGFERHVGNHAFSIWMWLAAAAVFTAARPVGRSLTMKSDRIAQLHGLVNGILVVSEMPKSLSADGLNSLLAASSLTGAQRRPTMCRTHMVLLTWVCVVLSVGLACTDDDDDDVFVQIMTADANWTDSSFTGHAFVCVQLKRNTGLQEDCYGFYRRSSAKALVGGPGVVGSEFDFDKHPPTRFSNIKVSITKPISNESRTKILGFIKGFDKDFTLSATNCVTFANEVARLAGLKAPDSTNFTTPVSYVEKLRELNPGF